MGLKKLKGFGYTLLWRSQYWDTRPTLQYPITPIVFMFHFSGQRIGGGSVGGYEITGAVRLQGKQQGIVDGF